VEDEWSDNKGGVGDHSVVRGLFEEWCARTTPTAAEGVTSQGGLCYPDTSPKCRTSIEYVSPIHHHTRIEEKDRYD
jgi:hypothetical protein